MISDWVYFNALPHLKSIDFSHDTTVLAANYGFKNQFDSHAAPSLLFTKRLKFTNKVLPASPEQLTLTPTYLPFFLLSAYGFLYLKNLSLPALSSTVSPVLAAKADYSFVNI